MVASFFSRKPKLTDVHYALYSAIVAQSRQPVFYAEWGVPDTLTGRFDMISLHMALVLRRLQTQGATCRDFSQALFDLFFKDMDRSLREMGVGDISVPKRIAKMGSLFYGLVDALTEALSGRPDSRLENALARNIIDQPETGGAAQLAAYTRAEADRLAGLPIDVLLAGKLAEGTPE